MNDSQDMQDVNQIPNDEFVTPKKYYRDNHVGVLISPNYGAGWSTWMSDGQMQANALFDYDLIEYIIENSKPNQLSTARFTDKQQKQFQKIAESKNYVYLGGLELLEVQWVRVGTEFNIYEYDGAESIRFKEQYFWYKA